MNLRRALLAFGTVCLCAAVLLSVYNLVSSDRAAVQAADVVESLVPLLIPPMEGGVNQNALPVPEGVNHPEQEMPTVALDGTRYLGHLEIPSLDLDLPIAASFSMEQLTKTPALYAGSVYKGNLVIAAHNYHSHFGRLNRMKAGDEVRLTLADGRIYSYTAGWLEKMSPSEHDAMVTDVEWDLTLFTCTYDGKQRLTLRCVAAED